jgi:hypothetical protein
MVRKTYLFAALLASPLFAQTPRITVPGGTALTVRINETITTTRNRPGDRFDGVLTAPLVSQGRTIAPAGTTVHGTVREAAASGRLAGRAVLAVELTDIDIHRRHVPIETGHRTVTSTSHKKRNWAWIGGGAGGGALIGGLVSGTGAAIGAGAGAAAGLTTAAISGRKQVRIPAETVLTFRLVRPLTV